MNFLGWAVIIFLLGMTLETIANQQHEYELEKLRLKLAGYKEEDNQE